MSYQGLFTQEIIEKIKHAEEASIIRPVRVNQTDQENELVFFFKPELLKVEDHEKIGAVFNLVKEKFNTFHVQVSGAAIVPGKVLEQHEIMNRHYGFINQLSRKASEMIDAEMRQKIVERLNLSNPEDYQVLGGHEFLNTFKTDIASLSKVWFAQEANKLRSGFYFIADTFKGQPIILVNGFHPSQLEHFTRQDHRIYLMLLHTNTDWESMKFELVGDTFPERADQASIRGELFAHPSQYGQQDVGINTNGVHLSAGPFEAAFEVVNFFGPLIDLDPAETPPLAIRKVMEDAQSCEQALQLLENPAMAASDLFSETENMNTTAAVNFVTAHFAGSH